MNNGLQAAFFSAAAYQSLGSVSLPLLAQRAGEIVSGLQREYPGLFDEVAARAPSLKAFDRACPKVFGDYGGDASLLADGVRTNILLKTADQLRAARAYVDRFAGLFGVERVKDRLSVPSETGFRDYTMTVSLPEGFSYGEIRFEIEGFHAFSRATHDIYREIQSLERKAVFEGRDMTLAETFDRQVLLDRVRDLHSLAAWQYGLDSLLSDDGRALLAAHDAERLTTSCSFQISGMEDNSRFAMSRRFSSAGGGRGALPVPVSEGRDHYELYFSPLAIS